MRRPGPSAGYSVLEANDIDVAVDPYEIIRSSPAGSMGSPPKSMLATFPDRQLGSGE
jgi:hypothetical protein